MALYAQVFERSSSRVDPPLDEEVVVFLEADGEAAPTSGPERIAFYAAMWAALWAQYPSWLRKQSETQTARHSFGPPAMKGPPRKLNPNLWKKSV